MLRVLRWSKSRGGTLTATCGTQAPTVLAASLMAYGGVVRVFRGWLFEPDGAMRVTTKAVASSLPARKWAWMREGGARCILLYSPYLAGC